MRQTPHYSLGFCEVHQLEKLATISSYHLAEEKVIDHLGKRDPKFKLLIDKHAPHIVAEKEVEFHFFDSAFSLSLPLPLSLRLCLVFSFLLDYVLSREIWKLERL